MGQSHVSTVSRIAASAALALSAALSTIAVAGAAGASTVRHPDRQDSSWWRYHHTHVSGRITVLGASSVTIKRYDGATATYATTTSTRYFEGGVVTTTAALALGEAVDLVLTPRAPQAIVRLTIDVVHWTGVVSGVSGAAITIGPASSPRTIQTSSTTTFLFGNGTTATLSNVLVGDSVSVKGVNTVTARTIDANSVVIIPAELATHVSGRVSALGTNSVTVTRSGGSTATYATTTSTTYVEGGAATTASALALGEAVDLVLTASAPQSVVQVTIDVIHFRGTVTQVSGDVITVKNSLGATEVVTTTSTTTFTLSGGGTAALGDVIVGDQVLATGVNGVGSGTLTASSVEIGSLL